MKKIRQRNDIDIVVQLKNNEGVALDPTLCSDMTVYLTCGTKKFYISEFEKHADGRIKFRFLAEQQTKLGVYNVTISAVTEDGRTFTTDACNAFNLVACSCNAGEDAGEVNVESVEVDATFEISAWGMVSDIIDKGTLDHSGIVSLCESDEIGIFTYIDSSDGAKYTLIKPFIPQGAYNFLVIKNNVDMLSTLSLVVRGGDKAGHGGYTQLTDEVITADSNNPVSSKAVYNAIYSVLNTEV